MSDVEPTLPEPTHILVLANETVAGRSLVEALRGHAARGPIRVTVLCPQNDPLSGYVVYEESRRSAAERRLRRTLDMLHEAGIAARGMVVDPDPLQALRDGLYQQRPELVIISTHPQQRSGWLRQDLIERARKLSAVPVEHVVVDLESTRERAQVLVLANQTIVGAPLLDAIHERVTQSPAQFTLIAPADEPGAQRRLEAALRTLREAGVDASGYIGDPDPYTSVMNALRDEAIDEIVISTFPGRTSGWLRRDLVQRVRGSTSVPVRHVEVSRREVEAAS
ncbi:MAG: hypothetical protein U0R69_13735 [Gaiellales bacterium]